MILLCIISIVNEYTRVTNTSQFASETFPSIYENNIVYSYFYYDKVNGTILYGLKMYNITTEDETTIFTGEEPTGSTPEIFGDMIVYSVTGVSLNLYNLSTNDDIPIYEGVMLTTPWNLNENYVLFTVLDDGVYLYKYNNNPPNNFNITIKPGLGLGVTVIFDNNGSNDALNEPWEITVQGGLLGRINKTVNGTIDIPVGGSKTVKTGMLFGFGAITISAKIADEEQTAKELRSLSSQW